MILFLLACGGGAQMWPEAPPADPCAAGALPAGESVIRVEHGGRTRQALVWHPTGPGPHDVVVNLHSFRAEPRRQNHYTGWIDEAERRNAILVGPDGQGATWNAGNGCCGRAAEKDSDDVAFLDALVARIEATSCTSGRVLATGIGNGAMMAERWACESGVPDAVVSVGGALQVAACAGPPVPWLHYHGENDTFHPPGGGPGRLPLAHAEAAWRARNLATGEAAVNEAGALVCATWPGAAPTVSCTVKDGGIAWPGAADGHVDSPSKLADATRGGAAWVETAWSEPAGVAPMPAPVSP